MAQTIILKRSAVQGNIPTTSQLELGEIGINTVDGKIFIKKDDGTTSIIEVGGSSATSDPIEHDYTSTAGQTDFSIVGVALTYLGVFVNGIKRRSSDYTITDDGSDTTVTFSVGLNSNDWVQLLEY